MTAAESALGAVEWRAAWESAGVLCDRVSATVLVLNLNLRGTAAAVGLTEAGWGEPVWLTARSLSGQWKPGSNREVRVCENPSIIEAAADALGSRSPALICTYGRPSTAATTLLDELPRDGVTLHLSADRDPAGEQIVEGLTRAYPGSVAWGAEWPGLYEEERLTRMLADLQSGWKP